MLERGRETELVRCRPVPAWFQESLRDVSWVPFQEMLGIGFFRVFFQQGRESTKTAKNSMSLSASPRTAGLKILHIGNHDLSQAAMLLSMTQGDCWWLFHAECSASHRFPEESCKLLGRIR